MKLNIKRLVEEAELEAWIRRRTVKISTHYAQRLHWIIFRYDGSKAYVTQMYKTRLAALKVAKKSIEEQKNGR